MASAEKKTEQVISLTLTEREASVVQALLAFTYDVDPEFPEISSVFVALRGAGVEYTDLEVVDAGTGGLCRPKIENNV